MEDIHEITIYLNGGQQITTVMSNADLLDTLEWFNDPKNFGTTYLRYNTASSIDKYCKDRSIEIKKYC